MAKHPKWGYNIAAVKGIHYLLCEEIIGGEPFTEITTLARFGQMLFCHKRCENKK